MKIVKLSNHASGIVELDSECFVNNKSSSFRFVAEFGNCFMKSLFRLKQIKCLDRFLVLLFVNF